MHTQKVTDSRKVNGRLEVNHIYEAISNNNSRALHDRKNKLHSTIIFVPTSHDLFKCSLPENIFILAQRKGHNLL